LRITLLTGGSRGDIDPFLALGLGLERAGHRVLLACNPEHEDRVREAGIEVFPFRRSLSEVLETPDGQEAHDPGGSLLRWLPALRRALRRAEDLFHGFVEDSYEASREADALVASPMGFAAPHLAEKLGIPYAWGLLQPMSPTRSFPIFPAPLWLKGPGIVNRLSYGVAARIAWSLLRRPVSRWRSDAGLPGISLRALRRRVRSAPVLYGFSGALLPRPADWPSHHHLTGFWFFDPPADDWRPPPGLEEFLAAGSRPIYIGLGSLTAPDLRRLTRQIREALERTGRRAVVLSGSARREGLDRSARIFRMGSAPHSWLLPRMAGAVHHGGVGTTGAALRAGIPSFVVPGVLDQHFWGRCVAEIGAGPPPVPARRLTTEALVRGIEALDEEPLRRRAEELGLRIAGEDGVGTAVALVERLLVGGGRP
jgi:UDP:flavonoid glycosyltransferase YjiC (YdhE family)